MANRIPTFANELQATARKCPIGHAVIFLDANGNRKAGVVSGRPYINSAYGEIRVPLFVTGPDDCINQVSPARSRILSVIAPREF